MGVHGTMKIHRWFAVGMVLAALTFAATVGRVYADNDPAAPYIAVLKDPKSTNDNKGNACSKLMDMGPKAASAVPVLTDLLKDPAELMRDYAISTLASIGAASAPAIPALQKIADADPSSNLRMEASDAIKQIRAAGPPPAATPAPRPNNPPPPSADPWMGNFSSPQISMAVTSGQNGNYSGTFTLGNARYPFTATGDGKWMKGQFTSGNSKFDFTADLNGDKVTLKSGTATYQMDRAH